MEHGTVICIVLFGLFHISVPVTIPIGMFGTECQDRHFWLAIRSSFLSHKFRFDVEDSSGVHSLSHKWAAECGYTLVLDSWGDLVLRASYLACHVENQRDSEFRLLVWFVNQDPEGEESTYPLLLTCPLLQPWSPREIVCEENYMEVSVMRQIPPANHKGTEWLTPAPVESDEGLREWRVVFRVPGHHPDTGMRTTKEETVPVRMAHLLGYHVNTTQSRILLRCAYGSRLAYTLQEGGVEVEVISATILYKHQWTLLRVDTSVACTTSKATMDGTHILWSLPQVLPPLVHPPFRDGGLRVGVGGHYLSECVARNRGYEIRERNGTVEIRIPFGAEGGYVKSHVTNNQYSQSYFIDLFYMHQWEDAQWSLTQHRSFRQLSILHLPRTPSLINNTVPSEGEFSVALGPFPHDVSLVNLTVAGQPVSWAKAESVGIRISHVPFPNGTHSYLLQTPFSHPLVSQKYVGDRYRRYSLSVVFSLLLSPHGAIYQHPATVESHLQDVVLPSVEGECTQRGVRLLVHYGNMDSQWGVYVGGHRLDWELVKQGGYGLETRDDHFSLEVPLYGPGMAYERLGMQGLVVSVFVNMVHMATAEEQSHIQRCVFPVGELLVCLPDGKMVVLVDTSGVSPPIDPKRTALLDSTCGPVETDRTRALFSFPIDSCGTIRTVEEDHVVYSNEVRYTPKLLPQLKPLSHPYPHYRIPIGCFHPVNGTHTLTIYQPHSLPPPPPPTPPPRSRSRSLRSLGTGGHRLHRLIRGRKRHILQTGG